MAREKWLDDISFKVRKIGKMVYEEMMSKKLNMVTLFQIS